MCVCVCVCACSGLHYTTSGWGRGGGEREIMYLSLHCHHQNDFCIKMGSDEVACRAALITPAACDRKLDLESVRTGFC